MPPSGERLGRQAALGQRARPWAASDVLTAMRLGRGERPLGQGRSAVPWLAILDPVQNPKGGCDRTDHSAEPGGEITGSHGLLWGQIFAVHVELLLTLAVMIARADMVLAAPTGQ